MKFIFENYYKLIRFTEKDSYYALGGVKKRFTIFLLAKARELYQFF